MARVCSLTGKKGLTGNSVSHSNRKTKRVQQPNLVTKRLFGRWMLFDAQRRVFEKWLRPYYEEPLPEFGAYQFVRCRKVASPHQATL